MNNITEMTNRDTVEIRMKELFSTSVKSSL
jgi:hypothetical protein